MSELRVNSIEKRNGNNVAMSDPLKLKSVTTTQRDALSSPQAGDTVYNSSTGTIDYYNGTEWFASSATTFTTAVDYLVVAGGGGTGGANGTSPTAATANTGGGGGGSGRAQTTGRAGGSGVVILRYHSGKTIANPGGGLTMTTATVSTDKVTTITAGTGNITFA